MYSIIRRYAEYNYTLEILLRRYFDVKQPTLELDIKTKFSYLRTKLNSGIIYR